MKKVADNTVSKLILCGAYLISGIPVLNKFMGTLGVTIYLLIGIVFFFGLIGLINKLNERYLSMIFLTLATISFFVVYPFAQKRSSVGLGSDRDEAISIAVKELIKFHNPYNFNHPTYFGNPISSLPGSLIIHIPSEILFHNSAYTEPILLVISIVLLFVVDSTKTKYLIAAISYSPVFWQDFLTGGDFATSSILTYVLLTLFLKWKILEWNRHLGLFCGIALGLSLCTRIPMLLLLSPVLFTSIYGNSFTVKLRMLSIPISIFFILFFGFASLDFSNFTPVKTLDKSGGIIQTIGALLFLILYFQNIQSRSKIKFDGYLTLEEVLAPIGFLITIIPTFTYDSWSIYYSFSFGVLGFVAFQSKKQLRQNFPR